MALVGAALGVDPDTPEGVKKIATETGQPERYIYRWRAGTNALNLKNAVSMLTSANLLRSGAEAAGEPESPHLILEGLVDAVADLTKSHRAALTDLQDVRTRLAQAEAALVPAKAGRTRKRASTAKG